MSYLDQKGQILTLWAHGIFTKPSFLDFPVNSGILGLIISECTHPQAADQLANCSTISEDWASIYILSDKKMIWNF